MLANTKNSKPDRPSRHHLNTKGDCRLQWLLEKRGTKRLRPWRGAEYTWVYDPISTREFVFQGLVAQLQTLSDPEGPYFSL